MVAAGGGGGGGGSGGVNRQFDLLMGIYVLGFTLTHTHTHTNMSGHSMNLLS